MPVKVYLTENLDNTGLNQAINLGAGIIVCIENEVSDLPAHIRVINADEYRVEGTWKTYAFNRQLIDGLLRKYPRSFRLNSYSIAPALYKMTYWMNSKKGSLFAACEKLGEDYIIVNDFRYFSSSYFKELIKYFRHLTGSIFRKNETLNPPVLHYARIGILVNNSFELGQYKRVIEKLSDNLPMVFHYGNLTAENIKYLGSLDIHCIDLSTIRKNGQVPWINPFRLSRDELKIVNVYSENVNMIATELARYESVKSTGIQKLLINVGENIPVRNLLQTVFEGSAKVYNTMNGMKSGEAQDADVCFDRWFVWDHTMKKLMTDKYGMKGETFIVSGHLSEELIAEWTYSGSLNYLELGNKKVISLFSLRGKRKEKLDVLGFLYSYLESRDDVLLLIKPHPLERPEDYLRPGEKLKGKVMFINETQKNSKESLFDQLILSDLSIVFGSTVALESRWMGTPCITYEYRSVSLIYCAGDEWITHIRDINSLESRLNSLEKKTSGKPVKLNSASSVIAGELSSSLNETNSEKLKLMNLN